ncbi:HNH endonuclease family protein [Actinomadura sp. ATCC 31491]|uniref:HNH endonuclease family protein n=1 Tax=Actinomadura luzonensis TaxID=2805427 RepID=A0ABT0G5F0_9ACTN|nr:HNH endonuclease family protein [Actinomadura luzonensis]MCK2219848.1 HNH endonuclease family protein [Actinomadura luzonensis]
MAGLSTVAMLTAGCGGGAGAQLSTADDKPAKPDSASISDARKKLAKLDVKGRAPRTGFDRDNFGPAWSDVDHNGCDTRNDILKRDLTDETFKSGTHDCIVLTGTLKDPYSGKTIEFKRGQDTSTAVQIDHLVPLSDAWQKGAQQWSATKRKEFANDPLNLQAVDGPLNGQKSDSDAATWLPPRRSYRCTYVARQIDVKAKYGVWVTSGEKSAMEKILDDC